MCLHNLDKETKQVTEGWKIFTVIDNKLQGIIYNFKFKTNKWIEDPKNNSIYYGYKNDDEMRYKTGFHFFINKEDAENDLTKFNNVYEKIYKIKVRNIVATGLQDEYKVGVAREIFIEDE